MDDSPLEAESEPFSAVKLAFDSRLKNEGMVLAEVLVLTSSDLLPVREGQLSSQSSAAQQRNRSRFQRVEMDAGRSKAAGARVPKLRLPMVEPE